MLDSFLFSKKLIDWYMLHKRDLPWRNTRDPYEIWISEIILQQTRVAQGFDYYLKFLQRFPDIISLANADMDDVLVAWQGLGYYSRAINLHQTAKYIATQLDGVFPNNYNDLVKLKGIGLYTASAILSFAFDLPYAVCDGNVMRVISRIFGVNLPIKSVKARQMIHEIVDNLLLRSSPAIFNQAIMEFGAIQCRPINPICRDCVFINECFAYQKSQVKLLPVKSIQKETANLYFHFFLVLDEQSHFLITQRDSYGIWRNLYTLPYIESDSDLNTSRLFESVTQYYVSEPDYLISSDIIFHRLTHRKIVAQFHVYRSKDFSSGHSCVLITKDMLPLFAFPQLIVKQFDWIINQIE